jgi:hypothetical protein
MPRHTTSNTEGRKKKRNANAFVPQNILLQLGKVNESHKNNLLCKNTPRMEMEREGEEFLMKHKCGRSE